MRRAPRPSPLALASLSGCLALGLLPPPAVAQARPENVVTSLAIFAGTSAGLWRSRDWGSSWERVDLRVKIADDTGTAGAVRSILPVGPRVYVGADGGLFVSEDFGGTWTRRATQVPVLAILTSRYFQADPTVFLGTAAGLLKSIDGGRSFDATPIRGTPVHRLEWPGPALVVGTGRGVLVSVDSGATFAAPGDGLPEGEIRAMALSSFYPVDPVLFAGVGQSGVYRSSDGAKTWTAAGLSGRVVTDLFWLGPFLYSVTDAGLFRSDDTGRSWSPLGEGLSDRKPTRLLFPLAPESGAEAFLATDQGLYRTADGCQRWRPAGLQGQEILCAATFPPPNRSGERSRRRSR